MQTIKIMEPCTGGYYIRDQFTLLEGDAPEVVDVPYPVRVEGLAGPLRRYKFRLRTDEAAYYTPVELGPMTVEGEA